MFPQGGNVTDISNFPFPSSLQNTETRYFVLWTYSWKSCWGCIAIHQNVCSRSLNQNCRVIFLKMSRNKSFDVRAKFGAIYSASKTENYLLKNSTMGNRLLFSELANIEFTCPENWNWCLLLPDTLIYFWNSKTISQLNFERLLVTDCCSNDFSEIPLAYLLYQLKPIPEISVKNISKFFY